MNTHGITTGTPGLPFLSRFGYINERGMSPALQEVNAVAEPSVFATWSATNPLAPQTLLNTMEVPSSDSSSSNGVPAPPVTAGARLEGHGISAKRWRKQIEGFKERENDNNAADVAKAEASRIKTEGIPPAPPSAERMASFTTTLATCLSL